MNNPGSEGKQHLYNLQRPQKKIPYRPGAQWPIGARGTKGDWRLPISHNLQYWDVLVKKIIDWSFLPSGFPSPIEPGRFGARMTWKRMMSLGCPDVS